MVVKLVTVSSFFVGVDSLHCNLTQLPHYRVQLRDKAGALLGHAMVLSRRVDSEYKVAQRARYLLADAVTRLTMLVGR